MKLTVVILTINEELHIARAIGSVKNIADRIVVVDSGSTDATLEIACNCGAEVLSQPFVSHAKQFNWALENLPADTEWVLRMDADEIVSQALANEMVERLPNLPPEIAGVTLARRIAFMRQPMRYGGLFPVHVVRLFRYGRGQSEDRWMDEHIEIDGDIVSFKSELLDDNLKPLRWWIDKHNDYASREVIEMLDAEYGILGRDSKSQLGRSQASGKRWVKENIYLRLPSGVRSFIYFLYRYVLRLGFLDGRAGAAFHVMQGFWYRYLVDLKKYEVEQYISLHGCEVHEAVEQVLGIKLDGSKSKPAEQATQKPNS